MAHPLRERIACGEVCRYLRTKAMFVPGDDGPPPEVPHPAATAVFWCNRSGWAMGPDLSPADPGGCGPSRGCFEADVTG